MDLDALKNPWVIGAGVVIGVALLMRGRASGPDYSPIIATNALAAQTSVQLSGLQAQVIDSNNARLAANYAVDGAVVKSAIESGSKLAIASNANATTVKVAKLQQTVGLKSLDTTLEAIKLQTDLATKQAGYKFQVDSIYANNAPAIAASLAQISSNTTIQVANRQAEASERIARINADRSIKEQQTRADSDMFGDVLGFAGNVAPFFF